MVNVAEDRNTPMEPSDEALCRRAADGSREAQPFRVLLWKYSEATTFFAFYSISLLIDLQCSAWRGMTSHCIA